MNRRQFSALVPLAFVAASPTFAHHGWSSFDETKPIYLEGIVKSVKWQNPHAEIVLERDANAKPPATLSGLPSPKQQNASINAQVILAKASLPSPKYKTWEIEFAPLSRMETWRAVAPKVGERVAVVGYTFKDESGAAILRVEYWIIDGKAVPLRSSPAG